LGWKKNFRILDQSYRKCHDSWSSSLKFLRAFFDTPYIFHAPSSFSFLLIHYLSSEQGWETSGRQKKHPNFLFINQYYFLHICNVLSTRIYFSSFYLPDFDYMDINDPACKEIELNIFFQSQSRYNKLGQLSEWTKLLYGFECGQVENGFEMKSC
jgi:hypothetical protein